MTPHTIRYTVKPDQAALNEELLRAVFSELEQIDPPGLRYAAFKLKDGLTFIHFVWMDTDQPRGSLPHMEALRAFHAGLRERCDEPPARTELSQIGSFRMFDE